MLRRPVSLPWWFVPVDSLLWCSVDQRVASCSPNAQRSRSRPQRRTSPSEDTVPWLSSSQRPASAGRTVAVLSSPTAARRAASGAVGAMPSRSLRCRATRAGSICRRPRTLLGSMCVAFMFRTLPYGVVFDASGEAPFAAGWPRLVALPTGSTLRRLLRSHHADPRRYPRTRNFACRNRSADAPGTGGKGERHRRQNAGKSPIW